MHRRVGKTPPACLIIVARIAGAQDIIGEPFAVIGQIAGPRSLPGRLVRMAVFRRHGFGIAHACRHPGHELPDRPQAQTAMAIGQQRRRDRTGCRLVEAEIGAQPRDHLALVLVVQQKRYDLDLPRQRERPPAFPEELRGGQAGGGLIAKQFRALVAFEIEFRRRGKPKKPAYLVEGQLFVLEQGKRDQIALRLLKPTRGSAGFDNFEVPHLLPDAKLLRQGMRPGTAETIPVVQVGCRLKRAFADQWRFQVALKKDRVVNSGAGIRRHFGMMFRLTPPDCLELRQHHLPERIKIVLRLSAQAPVPDADGFALLVAAIEKFSERAGLFGFHHRTEPAGGFLDDARFLVALFGLAVGLKAATLIEMKQATADMVQRLRRVQRARTDRIRIERFERFAGLFLAGHQTGFDQRLHQISASFQITITKSARTPRMTSCNRIRTFRLWVAAVRINSDAART